VPVSDLSDKNMKYGYSIKPVREAILKVLRRNKVIAEKFLDIGGSTGKLTEDIARIVKASEVSIIDVNSEALEIAKQGGLVLFAFMLTSQFSLLMTNTLT